jgi:hypothetical protein
MRQPALLQAQKKKKKIVSVLSLKKEKGKKRKQLMHASTHNTERPIAQYKTRVT